MAFFEEEENKRLRKIGEVKIFVKKKTLPLFSSLLFGNTGKVEIK
jgi:hypothetical protein